MPIRAGEGAESSESAEPSVSATDRAGLGRAVTGVLLFAAVVAFIDPLRETALDDDWAYALTVSHLFETGIYRANDWLSANILFQAHWGALFAGLFGFSHGILRLSSVVLFGAGLWAFHGLAREQGLGARPAWLATLALMASPLVLQYGFNFMSDGPFLACFVMAALGYTRGIGRRSVGWMLAGGVAAAATILTRQFGVALVGSLALVWLLETGRARKIPLYALGAALPLVATVWQLRVGTIDPPWASGFSIYTLGVYYEDLSRVLLNAVWRPTAALHYLAMFSLPLLAVAALGAASGLRRGVRPKPADLALAAALAVYLGFGFVVGHEVLGFRWQMPFLPWNYNWLRARLPVTAVLTGVTTIGGIYVGWAMIRRYWDAGGWTGLPPARLFLDGATGLLLAQYLIFFQLGDRYLLGAVPFVLIVLCLRLSDELDRWPRVALAAVLAMLLVSAVWVRGILVHEEARWAVAEEVRAQGVPARQIYGSWMWNSHYGFSDWLEDIDYDYAAADGFHDYFQRWLPERKRRARFWVVVSDALPDADPDADRDADPHTVQAARRFRDVWFRERTAYALERSPAD